MLALGLVAGLAGLLLWPLWQGVEFSNYRWLPEDNPVQQTQRAIHQRFTGGEQVVVAVTLAEGYFRPALLDELDLAYRHLQALPHVKSVETPLHARLIIEDGQDGLRLGTYRQAMQDSYIASLDEYRQRLRQSDYWGVLLSRSERVLALVVNLYTDLDAPLENARRRTAVIRGIEAHLVQTRHLNDYQLAGEARIMERLDSLSAENLYRLLPITGLVALVLLALFYREPRRMLTISACAALVLMLAFNVSLLLGHPLSTLSLMLPLLIIVIGIADSVHIVACWDAQIAREPGERLRQVLRQMWRPCLLTSLTTSLGFGVFWFSEIIPLSHFGLDAMLAMLLAYAVILPVTALLLYALNVSPRMAPAAGWAGRLGTRLADAGGAHARRIVIAALVLALLAGVSLSGLRTETNVLDAYFERDSDTYRAFDLVDAQLGGSGSMAVLLPGQSPGHFQQVAGFDRAVQLESALAAHDAVNHSRSMRLPVRIAHRALGEDSASLPDSQQQLAQELLFLEFSRSDTELDVLSSYVDFDYTNALLHLQTPNLNSLQADALVSDWAPILQRDAGATLGGSSYVFQQLSAYVVDTQLLTLSLTIAVMGLVFILTFGWRLGVWGMLVNGFPVLLVLGIVVALNYPLDFATVLIAGVSLGLCVDDTIHILHRYRTLNRSRQTGALRAALGQLATPVCITSILLVAGLLVLLLSNLVILQRFAAFTALGIGLTLVGVFLLLPALLAGRAATRR